MSEAILCGCGMASFRSALWLEMCRIMFEYSLRSRFPDEHGACYHDHNRDGFFEQITFGKNFSRQQRQKTPKVA